MAGIACQIGLQGMEQSRKAFALKITLRKTPALWAGLLLFPVLCSAQSAFDGTWADGHDQPLQGNPYYDTINIAVIDDHPGGKSPHIRYHQPGGIVRDSPSSEVPSHAGHWSVHWMKPEPMHAIESVENNSKPGDLPLLRVEIKVGT